MAEVQTVVAFPPSTPAALRTRKPAQPLRIPVRARQAHVVPMFGAKPALRERRQAGAGIAIALGFSAACWAGLAALIF